MVEHRIEMPGRHPVQHLADMIVGRDGLDTEEGMGIGASLAGEHLPLRMQEGW